MSKDDLIKGQSSELRQGFNPTLKKFFIEITDLETKNNITIYLDKKEYEIFGKDIFQNIEYFKDKV
jgi:hypothetical protein